MFVDELARAAEASPRGGFIGISGYTSTKTGEVANFKINGNVSYRELLARSVDEIENLEPETISVECPACEEDIALAEQAYSEVLISLTNRLSNLDNEEEADSGYEYIAPGLAVREGSTAIYIWGLLVSKEVVTEGEYRPVKSAAKTLVKRFIEKQLPVSKFRRFKLQGDNFEQISLGGKRLC